MLVALLASGCGSRGHRPPPPHNGEIQAGEPAVLRSKNLTADRCISPPKPPGQTTRVEGPMTEASLSPRAARDKAVAEVDEIWKKHELVRRRFPRGLITWTDKLCRLLCESCASFDPGADRICELHDRHDDVWLSLQCNRARHRRTVLRMGCKTCIPPRGPRSAPRTRPTHRDPWLIQ